MATTFNIVNDIHGRFVTCQRPIVIRVETITATQPVAHYRGKLFVELVPNSGNFIDTEVRMNGYSDEAGSDFYTFNVAEYCSNYFEDDISFYHQNWCGSFRSMLWREFILQIEPVLVQNDGSLQVEEGNIVETRKFIVTATNTMVDEQTSTLNDYIRMDKFVCNGNNDSGAAWFNSSKNKLMTNMPNNNVLDISKGFFYFFPVIVRDVANRDVVMRVTNASGQFYDFTLTSNDEHLALHIHPLVLSFWLLLLGAPNINLFLNNDGTLATSSINVTLRFVDSTTGALIRSCPSKTYKLVDYSNKCKSETFIFKNMRGNFDFFTATGEQKKSTEVSGVEYQRHTDFIRTEKDFGVMRGQHSVTNLLNKRKHH
jgi:hypothetical protein